MKAPTIILAVLCVALGFGWYKSAHSSSTQADSITKLNESLSNQVAELRTRLALEQGTAGQAQSNLQFIAQQRTTQLINTSNHLVQTHLLLKSAQAEAHRLQPELQSKAAQIALLQSQCDDLKYCLEALAPLQRQMAETKNRLAATVGERDALESEIGRLQVEKAELLDKLNDVPFLRLTLAKAEEDAEARRRLAKAGNHAPVDKKARLELQEDGTVRPVLSASTPAQK